MEEAVLLCIDFDTREVLSWWWIGQHAAAEARTTMHHAQRENPRNAYTVIGNELAENAFQHAALRTFKRFASQPL